MKAFGPPIFNVIDRLRFCSPAKFTVTKIFIATVARVSWSQSICFSWRAHLGDALSAKSWVDLRKLDDIDFASATRRKKNGVMNRILTLDQARLIEVLQCAAGADDTTKLQEKSIRDLLATIRGLATRRT